VDGTNRLELAISGMRCAGCSDTVTAALERVPGVEKAEVSYAAGFALVRSDPRSPPPLAALVAAVKAAGYSAAIAGSTAEREAWRADRRAAAVAALLAVVTLVVGSEPVVARLGHRLHAWAVALLAVGSLLGPGASFLRGAWNQLRVRRGGMDLLVAIGAGAATGSALLAALGLVGHELDHGHAAVWLVAFLRIGKLVESKVRASASSDLLALLDVLPQKARRVATRGDVKSEEEVDAASLRVDDLVVVRAAERAAADGVVVDGATSFDESAVTGEPMPVDKRPGDGVSAGSIAVGGRVVVRVTAVGPDSKLGQMAALVRKAMVERAPIASLADRVAAVFVPIVLLLAAATAVGWVVAGAPAATVVARTLATVVISCPCALALATPTALLAGTNVALKRGLLVRDAGVLEALTTVRRVLFDKTGTLTRGRPSVVATLVDRMDDDERTAAAALARASLHPAALAVAEARSTRTTGGGESAALVDVEESAGDGVRATWRGRPVRLGKLSFAAPRFDLGALHATSPSSTVRDLTLVAFGVDSGELRALWSLDDELRPTSRAAVAELARRGLAVELVTGDRVEVAQRVGRELGLASDAVHGDCTPAAKAQLVTQRQSGGSPVLFVGDGFNDGAALAAATVGAAIGATNGATNGAAASRSSSDDDSLARPSSGGTDLARAAGRLVLLRGEPVDVVAALDVARATMRVVKQNLVLAALYNVVAIPWAMGLLARFGVTAPEPAAAGLAMAASSLVVVGNAFRLRLRTPPVRP
jgi:Cu+-exporting ATPase